MGEKLCVFCVHLDYDNISSWESDCSGGTNGGYRCLKGHFYEIQPYDIDDVRTLYLRAEKCQDYEVAK